MSTSTTSSDGLFRGRYWEVQLAVAPDTSAISFHVVKTAEGQRLLTGARTTSTVGTEMQIREAQKEWSKARYQAYDLVVKQQNAVIDAKQTDIEKLQRKISENEKELNELTELTDVYELARTTLRNTLAAKERELAEAKSKLGAADGEVERLGGEIAELRKRIADAEKRHGGEVGRLRAEIDSLGKQKTFLEGELREARGKIEAQRTEIGELKAMFANGALEAMKEEKKALEADLGKHGAELAKLNSSGFWGTTFAFLGSKLTTAVTSVGVATEKTTAAMANVRARIEGLDRAIAGIKSGRTSSYDRKFLPPEAREQLAELERQLAESRGQERTLSGDLASMRSQLSTLQRSLTNAQRKIGDLERANGALRGRIVGLEGQLETAKAAKADTWGKCDSLKTQVGEKNAELAAKDGEIRQLLTKRADLERQLAEAKKGMEDMLRSLRHIHAETREIALGQLRSLRDTIKAMPLSMIPATMNLYLQIGRLAPATIALRGATAVGQLDDEISGQERQITAERRQQEAAERRREIELAAAQERADRESAARETAEARAARERTARMEAAQKQAELDRQKNERIERGKSTTKEIAGKLTAGQPFENTDEENVNLLKFCKIMANPAIEPTDAVDQTREDMMKGVGAVITEIIEKFTSQLREVRGDLSEIAVASAMKDQAKAMWAKFVNFAGDTSTGAKNYVQCFNELGRLAQAAPGEILAALAAGAH